MKRKLFFPAVLGIFPLLLFSAGSLMLFHPASKLWNSPEDLNQISTSADKTLSPYFFIQSEDPSVDKLPLKSTSADVNISGVIADVKVTQVYKNEGKSPIEAIYVFPGSTRAAVYGMKMTIGERVIVAKIAEKEDARRQYDQARNEGKTASLLEQERPNVFKMNIANIMPGDLITVELNYTEMLIPEEGVYEFVYPTVVGPRYKSGTPSEATASDKWVGNPYLHEGELPNYTFSINCRINAGMPLAVCAVPSHKTNINYENNSQAVITLAPDEDKSGNRDFIMRYRLADNKIQSGVLLYEGGDENYFLAMVQPPKRVTPEIIPPREYVFIVDVSGSMNGFPLNVSKTLLKDLIGSLRISDRFNVILFAGTSNLFSEESVFAGKDNIDRALAFIDRQEGSGGTELLPALKRALALQGTEGYARSFIIATDGYVDVERQAIELIKDNLDKANFFSFGIGTSVNRYLIEGLAHAGAGVPFIVENVNNAAGEAEKFRKYVQSPVLAHIKVEFNGLDAYDIEPASVPDVLAERPVYIIGKYRGKANGTIKLTGISGEGQYVSVLNAEEGNNAGNMALRQLWARERIRNYDDLCSLGESPELKSTIVNLGLKYNLLTRFTSFVAIDNQVRNQNGKSTRIEQPLPLPEGVSDMAVGYAASPSGNMKMNCVAVKSESVNEIKSNGAKDELEDADVKKEDDLVFEKVEQTPEFPGGDLAMNEYIRKNLVYPEIAKNQKIEGTVYVSFTVGKDGSIKNIKILRGLDPACDAEVLRIIRQMPKWTPGKQRGKPVETQMTIPIKFSLK